MNAEDVDLLQFSEVELICLRDLIIKRLKAIEAKRTAETMDALKEVAANMGLGVKFFPLENKRAKATPSYINPDTGETWAGRGRKPRWLQKFLDAGRTLDEFDYMAFREKEDKEWEKHLGEERQKSFEQAEKELLQEMLDSDNVTAGVYPRDIEEGLKRIGEFGKEDSL